MKMGILLQEILAHDAAIDVFTSTAVMAVDVIDGRSRLLEERGARENNDDGCCYVRLSNLLHRLRVFANDRDFSQACTWSSARETIEMATSHGVQPSSDEES